MGTVWLARNKENVGEQITNVFIKDPGELKGHGYWNCSNYLCDAESLGLPEIPHGTKQEYTLTATPVPQPKRAKELWGLWNTNVYKWQSYSSRGRCDSPCLYTTQDGAEIAAREHSFLQVRRYDTCEIDESLNPPS